jgi:hypothetical protein
MAAASRLCSSVALVQENGALIYCPGSHRRALRPHSLDSGVLGFSRGITDFRSADELGAVTVRPPCAARGGKVICATPHIVYISLVISLQKIFRGARK